MSVSINASDDMSSLLWANNRGASQDFAYAPFGSTGARHSDDSRLPGFNGERLDPLSQTYHLGNGYRTYKPSLMRFDGPDSWSPVGRGGLNQYAYCEGDPINRSDPSGHMSSGTVGGILGVIFGIVGAALAIWTFGTSIAAIAALETTSAITAGMAAETLASGLGVAAVGTGIASTATAKSDPSLSRALGWASLGLGLASFTLGAVDAIHAKVAGRSRPGALLDDHQGAGGLVTSAGRHIRLDGEMYDVISLSNDVYIFDDVHKNGRRFNMFAEGMLQRNGAGKLMFRGNLIDADAAVSLLKERGVDFSKYSSGRLVFCHSGDGGDFSFAKEFANLTRMPTKGYQGTIDVFAYDGDIVENLLKNNSKRDCDFIFKNAGFKIDKINPYEKHSGEWRTFTFRSINFEPS